VALPVVVLVVELAVLAVLYETFIVDSPPDDRLCSRCLSWGDLAS